MPPKVSVIIPTYNCAATIGETDVSGHRFFIRRKPRASFDRLRMVRRMVSEVEPLPVGLH
ncbi:MAG: glycosyltransferase [Candidatus Omnitrophica bacterium]|nr:glycosyltransferase [Candidatus Omnitrophota bacterium]